MEHDHSASDVEKEAVTVARPQGDVSRVEAPVTLKAYMMCVFAAFGGIFFGYDSGYISGVMGMKYFIETIEGPGATFLPSKEKSLITSILSAGTFFGALMGGDLADWVGRRPTIIFGCLIFIIGVILQTASQGLGLIVAGRLVAGFGVGFVSAIIILYMSEIAPRKVRGALVSGYQFCICVGLLLASCVDYGTQDRTDSGSYRIPIALQMAWALILAGGIFLLPESPRYFVRKGQMDKAAVVLSRLRDQPLDSDYVRDELAEIIANHEFEMQVVPHGNYFQQWANCFRGSIWQGGSYIRRTILGTSMQMMQQWTGCNFIFYFGTTFFQQLGTIDDPFLMSLRVHRRHCWYLQARRRHCHQGHACFYLHLHLLLCYHLGPWCLGRHWRGFPSSHSCQGCCPFHRLQLALFCLLTGNCIIAVITPYMVDEDKGNLGPKVFYIWGGLCTCCFVYAYLLVPETKGLTLEQVDQMLSESTPRTSAKWKPHTTFAAEMGMTEKAAVAAGHAENHGDSE